MHLNQVFFLLKFYLNGSKTIWVKIEILVMLIVIIFQQVVNKNNN